MEKRQCNKTVKDAIQHMEDETKLMEGIFNVTDYEDSTQQIEKYATQQMETYAVQQMRKVQCTRWKKMQCRR